MHIVAKWINKIHDGNKSDVSPVTCLSFSPDGSRLIVSAGDGVMVYDPNDGALIKLLRGHKSTVLCVAYSGDGRRFASGGADKTVIVWNSRLEGVLKYSHNDAIQCLAYNPVTYQLASCAMTDFGFWSSKVCAVQKFKIEIGRATSCSWSVDGLLLAIGLTNGYITIRNRLGEEKERINRHGYAVWSVLWTEHNLIVTDWSETISFYNSSGQQVMKERPLGILPMSISRIGELILVSGAGGWIIMTSEGIPINRMKQKWVSSIQSNNESNTIAIGCEDGTLCSHQAVFDTVHALYRDRYAFRENMTDVIIQHLTSSVKVRIKCHDRVQKIAIHKHRLAVQLPERIVVYEQGVGDGMLYQVKQKIPLTTDCSLLVVTSKVLFLCQGTKLEMIGGKGVRSWQGSAPIRYVKVAPIENTEVLLVGLSNGKIWKVSIQTPASEIFISTPEAVRCFDLSAAKSLISVVDENSICRTYNVATGELVFTEENVSSVSWHISCEELLAFSGGGRISIKPGRFPASTQPLGGSVVGFQGGQVFCLQSNVMQSINVPLFQAMYQYVKNKMFGQAYSIACLGVTTSDWEKLGAAALDELSLDIARKAFQHTENISLLQLVDLLQEILSSNINNTEAMARAELFAQRNYFVEAARIYQANSCEDKALEMYADLRMFHRAQQYHTSGNTMSITKKKAEWSRHIQDLHTAAEMFLAAGEVEKAVEIMAEKGWVEMLVETGRSMDKGDQVALRAVGDALKSLGYLEPASEIYQKLGDELAVINMLVESENWTRAFQLVKQYPQYKENVYIPYAHVMAQQNQFIEAQKAYLLGGKDKSATKLLEILINSAITEERFSDAAYLHWLFASQCLDIANAADNESERYKWVEKYSQKEKMACLYHAFESVHKSINDPFSLYQPDTLFNAAKIALSLVEKLSVRAKGISLFSIYLCLAKQGKSIGANKVASQMIDRIQALKIPTRFQEAVEVLTLILWGTGCNDGSEVVPLCYRCSHHLQPLDTVCRRCGQSSYYSCLTFESMPLVAFMPEMDIPLEEVYQLIESVPSSFDSDQETDGAQVLKIGGSKDAHDVFAKKPIEEDQYGKVVCSREDLRCLQPTSVVIVKKQAPLQPLFFRSLMPDLHVHACPHCAQLFYVDDIEQQCVVKSVCLFCRNTMSDDLIEPILTQNDSTQSADSSIFS